MAATALLIVIPLSPTFQKASAFSAEPTTIIKGIFDNLTIDTLIAFALGGGGIASLGLGMMEYRNNRILKRQQTLIELIEDFDKPGEMDLAKFLLDDFYASEAPGWEKGFKASKDADEYHKNNFKIILRDHDEPPEHQIGDKAEKEIRNSFDKLLEFLGYVGYMLDIGLITYKEARYFEYYVRKILEDVWVVRYVCLYNFDLFALLILRLNWEPKEPDQSEYDADEYKERYSQYRDNKECLRGMYRELSLLKRPMRLRPRISY